MYAPRAAGTCPSQTACGAGEAGLQKLFPSCLSWQVMKNEELGLELLNLANARSTLPRTESNHDHSPATANGSSAELEKARAAVSRLPPRKAKVRTPLPGRQLLGEQGSNRHLLLSLTKTSQMMRSPQNTSGKSWREM